MNRSLIGVVTAALVLAMALGALAQGGTPARPAARTIKGTDVQGLHATPAAEQNRARAMVAEYDGAQESPAIADALVERLTETGWFFRVEVRTERIDEDTVKLVVTVTENPIIKSVRFVGNTKLSADELQAAISSRPDTVMVRSKVGKDARAILKAYADKGYTLTEVTDINVSPVSGQLEFYILEPKIQEIRIEGRHKTKEFVIRRQLNTQPGDVYNEKTLQESLGNLQRTGLFDEISMRPDLGSEPGSLILTIYVGERPTGMAQAGGTYSSTSKLSLFVDVSDQNLRGTQQSLAIRAQFGNDSSYKLTYRNPWLDSRQTSMTMSAYDQKTLREVVAGTKSMTYDEERSGGSLIFGRPVFDRKLTRASATVRLDHISGSSSTVDPQLAPILLPTDVRSLGLSIVKDSRDSFLDATSGLYNSGSIEVAGFGGASFTKMEGELRRYFVVKPGRETEPDKLTIKRTFEMIPWIYASRLSLGTSFGQPPFLDQYFVGGTGANMLRGYADDRFPGKHHLIWNNELRVPLSLAVSGVAFVDVGDAWGGDYAATFGDAKMKLRAGYGVGLRVMTPIGPFRFDYAMPTTSGSKAQFHLGIGASF